MIEILVTLAVVGTGLWAMLDLHARLQAMELEVYQRTRALLLLDDMAARLKSNPAAAALYVTDEKEGVGAGTCPLPDANTGLAMRDVAHWCRTLQGDSATSGAPLPGGRGCLHALPGDRGPVYLLSVVWQGATPIAEAPRGIACGVGQYDLPSGSACARWPGRCRRFVSTQVQLANMDDL